MKTISRIAIGFIAIFLIVGFSSRFNILVEDLNSGQPCFKLDGGQVELNSFLVVEKREGKWDYKHPLWAFELKPGSALRVKQFNYGAVPSGFLETTTAKQLLSGVPYLAVGAGPGSAGSSEFIRP